MEENTFYALVWKIAIPATVVMFLGFTGCVADSNHLHANSLNECVKIHNPGDCAVAINASIRN